MTILQYTRFRNVLFLLIPLLLFNCNPKESDTPDIKKAKDFCVKGVGTVNKVRFVFENGNLVSQELYDESLEQFVPTHSRTYTADSIVEQKIAGTHTYYLKDGLVTHSYDTIPDYGSRSFTYTYAFGRVVDKMETYRTKGSSLPPVITTTHFNYNPNNHVVSTTFQVDIGGGPMSPGETNDSMYGELTEFNINDPMARWFGRSSTTLSAWHSYFDGQGGPSARFDRYDYKYMLDDQGYVTEMWVRKSTSYREGEPDTSACVKYEYVYEFR